MKQTLPSQTFTALIKAHQGIIHSICKAYFAHHEDRQDASQEIVLQLWKAYPHFRGEAKVSTWIYRVALNTALNLVKAHKPPTFWYDWAEDEDLADNASAVFVEGSDFVQFVLNQLNPPDKALLILHLEGYEYAEIAQILTLTLTNVSTKLSRIKSKLKKIFKPQDYEP
ncbi:MAG: RNA polymerase sigma factor [Microscillaceae bacterium]|jgi:RNA polymerase sigma-70 factor (ECF subfamily)|nr:RNA polymerase sigma factor [Microscillaceae bacterium]